MIQVEYLAAGLKSFTTMYCSVYACTTNNKNNSDGQLHFVSFPNAENGLKEKSSTKGWIEFCNRKEFRPSKNACICSRNFHSTSYLPSHSPEIN